MEIDRAALFALPVDEKLRLVEALWDDLAESDIPIPLPSWIDDEAAKRRDAMIENPEIGLDHDTVWNRIDKRNG